MPLIDTLRKIQPGRPDKAAANHLMNTFLAIYSGKLRSNVQSWNQAAIDEGLIVMEDLDNFEVEDAVLELRKTSAFLLRIPAAGRTIVFEPSYLTYTVPVWALVHLYPANSITQEFWTGLMIPPGGRREDSLWVALGEQYSHKELESDQHPNITSDFLDSLIEKWLPGGAR